MNMLERCAALLSAAQADPTRRTKHVEAAYEELRKIITNSAKRRITNHELAEDAVQLVLVRIWRRVTEKPGPISPVELRMLIDGTISNALRDDTRARGRNGHPDSAALDALITDTPLEELDDMDEAVLRPVVRVDRVAEAMSTDYDATHKQAAISIHIKAVHEAEGAP
jgi:DNA-directed RNA polymerase specialized sigma24 family protein